MLTLSYSKVESHFVDAQYYTKGDDISEVMSTEVLVAKGTYKPEQRTITTKKSNEVDALNGPEKDELTTQVKFEVSKNEKIAIPPEKASKPPILCYIPLSRRKKGESLFAKCLKNLKVESVKILKESFTSPLTKMDKGKAKRMRKMA